MYKKVHKIDITSSIYLESKTLSSFMFVIDMELIRMSPVKDDYLEMSIKDLQEGVREWKEFLRVAGGELKK